MIEEKCDVSFNRFAGIILAGWQVFLFYVLPKKQCHYF